MYNYYDKTKTIQLTRGDTMQMGFNFTVVVGATAVTDYKAVWHLKKKHRSPLSAAGPGTAQGWGTQHHS